MGLTVEPAHIHQSVLTIYLEISKTAAEVHDLLLCEKMLEAAYHHAARWNEHSRFFSKTLIDLADQYQTLGRIERARELYWRAMRQTRLKAVDEWSLARINDGLAQCYLTREDFRNAKPFCRRAVGLFEKLLGKNHRLLAPRLSRWALVSLKLGDFEKGLELSRRVQVICDLHAVMSTP